MRWDRLFAELEAQAEDLGDEERDALVRDLVDGEWASTPWRALLSGDIVLEVAGWGRLQGEVVMATKHFVHVRNRTGDVIVDAGAVVAVVSASRRTDPGSAVADTLGWRYVLRELRDAGSTVMVRRTDGLDVEGQITVIGEDFVMLRDATANDQVVTLQAVAVVSVRN